MRKFLAVSLVLAGAVSGASADVRGEPAPPPLPRGSAAIHAPDGGLRARFDVWLALTPSVQSRGLMEVRILPPSGGMLFLFSSPEPREFWMRKTRIPLDILFARGERIVRIHRNVPPCPDSVGNCPSYPSGEPADTVLEINAGLSRKLGIREGDRLSWETEGAGVSPHQGR